MRRIFLPILLALSACAHPVLSEQATQTEESVAPGINDNFKDDALNVKQWADRFTGESREVYNARFKVLSAIEIEPGDHVADIGAGTGLYVQLFANETGPDGRVYAVDIAQNFLDFIDESAAADGLKNVTTVLGEDRTSNLPSNSLDLIFHSDTYHHFEYPAAMNADLLRALKPGGEMYVLDFERIPGVSSDWIIGHVRAPKETVITEIKESGFILVEEIDLPELKENYLLRFRKE